MTFVAPPSRVPTVVHVVRYRFGPNSHPAIWRTILGLGRHFQNVVVSGNHPGYFPQSAVDGVRLANEAGIHVLAEQDVDGLGQPRVAARVSALVRRRYGQIDAVVGHLLGSSRAVYLARHLSAPTLAFFHGDDANIHLCGEPYGPAYDSLRASPAACFLGVSQNVVRRLIEFGMPRERTFLHHLGVDLPRDPSEPESGRPLKLVMTGLFRRQKGHEMAIQGFAEFVRRFPGASLHFIGGALKPEQRYLETKLKELVERMKLAEAIRFRGPMPVDDVARELAGADIALQTSVFVPEDRQVEGIPNAILEAMAAAVPVVATRHGGIPEAVVHERTGLLVDEYDIGGLVRALSRLGRDPGLRRRYGLEGRGVVAERFNPARQSDLMAERIRTMIGAYAQLTPAPSSRSRRARAAAAGRSGCRNCRQSSM